MRVFGSSRVEVLAGQQVRGGSSEAVSCGHLDPSVLQPGSGYEAKSAVTWSKVLNLPLLVLWSVGL